MFYQLVDEDCIIYSPNSKSFINTDKVLEKYGVHPHNFCLAKSIVGDKSDNIPGVPGVGYKKLAKEFSELLLKEDFDSNLFQLFITTRLDTLRPRLLENRSDSFSEYFFGEEPGFANKALIAERYIATA